MKRYFHSSVTALAMTAMVMSGVAPAFSQGKGSGRASSNRGGNDVSQNARENNRGGTASSLGALNAAHANANAQASAAANSQVGMIAIYKAAVLATAEGLEEVEAAQAKLDAYLLEQIEEEFVSEYETYDDYLKADPVLDGDEILYWETVNSLQQAIDDAIVDAAVSQQLEIELLEMAANKVTNEAIIAALWDLL